MCSCHENKGGDGGGEKKTVLFKKDRGAEQTTKGEKTISSNCLCHQAECRGFKMHGGGGGVGRSSEEEGAEGRRRARCQPVKDAGTIQSEECVCVADPGQQRGGFSSRWTHRELRALKMLTLITEFQSSCSSVFLTHGEKLRAADKSCQTLCVCVCVCNLVVEQRRRLFQLTGTQEKHFSINL